MKYKHLIHHLAQIRTLKTKPDFLHWMDELIPLIDVTSYGLSRWTVIHDKPVTVNGLLWFEDYPGYKELYFDDGLFRLDPISDELIRQISAGKLDAQFWQDTYKKQQNASFFEAIATYPFADWEGYTVAKQINPITFDVLSVTGPELTKSAELERILHCLINSITHIPLEVLLSPLLTHRQHVIFQLLHTSVTATDIGYCLNIAPSTVEKHYDAIRRKIKVGWRSDIGIGWTVSKKRQPLPEKYENSKSTGTR